MISASHLKAHDFVVRWYCKCSEVIVTSNSLVRSVKSFCGTVIQSELNYFPVFSLSICRRNNDIVNIHRNIYTSDSLRRRECHHILQCAISDSASLISRNIASNVIDSELVEMVSVYADLDLRYVRVAINQPRVHNIKTTESGVKHISKLSNW